MAQVYKSPIELAESKPYDYEKAFEKGLEILKGDKSGYSDYLNTLAQTSDYSIDELENIVKTNPHKIARWMAEDEWLSLDD